MKRLRGLLLDVDGTLVDSNAAHAHAWVEALAEQGIHVPFEKVRKSIGMGGDKLLPQVASRTEDSPEGKKVSQRRGEIFKAKYLPTLRPTRGARELLLHLHSQGFKLVVASSAKENELHGLLHVCGAENVIEAQTSADAADHSKPDPDIVLAALQAVGLPPDAVVLIGDTPYDIEAAQRAGVATIALRCGGSSDADLVGALALYDDPADLLAHYDASPLNRPRP